MSASSNYPLKGHKGSINEGGIRTNAFIHSPLFAPSLRATKYQNLVDVTDWLPTILDFAKCEYGPVKKLDGVSHYPHLLLGYQKPPRIEILHGLDPLKVVPEELIEPRSFPVIQNRKFSIKMHSSIRLDKWKLITGPTAAKSDFSDNDQFRLLMRR